MFTAHCLLVTAYCPLPAAHCLLPTIYCPLLNFLQHTVFCPLFTAHCLLASCYCPFPLPTVHFPLFTAQCCPLFTAHCLLGSAYCTIHCPLPTVYCSLFICHCLLPELGTRFFLRFALALSCSFLGLKFRTFAFVLTRSLIFRALFSRS